jgi:hypothetical protein
MSPITSLTSGKLYRPWDAGRFTFATTAELGDLTDGIGQMRATDAALFGFGMRHSGYNLYVMGQSGGKFTLIRELLDQRMAGRFKHRAELPAAL